MNRSTLLVAVLALGACASTSGEEAPTRHTRSVTRLEVPNQPTLHIETTRDESAIATRLAATPDEAWAALLEVYGELGIRPEQLSVLDTRQRQMGVRGVTLRRIAGQRLSRWMDCGQDMAGAKADLYEVQVTLLSEVRPGENGGSVVQSFLAATARDRGTSTNPVTCSTSGTLEQEIGKRVQLRALKR